MASSPTTTLFTVQVYSRRQPLLLAVSALIHGALIALIFFGILDAPRVIAHPRERYMLREIDLEAFKAPPLRAVKGVRYPGPLHRARASTPQGAAGKAAAAALRALAQTVHAKPGPQTLIQPNLPVQMALREKFPVPQMLIWKANKVVVKKIVAPLPQPPVAAEAKPSFEAPNQEVPVSDVNLASSPLSQLKLRILPSTTTPVVVSGIDLQQAAPSTVTQIKAQPTPAAVLSLSNMRTEGTAALPPVNESAMREAQGGLTPSPSKAGSEAGSDSGTAQGSGRGANQGNHPGAGTGTGAGQSANANSPSATISVSSGQNAQNGAGSDAGSRGQPAGAAKGPAQGANNGNGQYANASATQITLPKTGVFSSVVVGNSLQDQYPELADVWNGRMAYTVYLHVGLAHSWILQYSLPSKAAILSNGVSDRLDAPWPYSIVRPNLPPDAVDADALMIHGYVNSAGRFEGLSVVLPQGFAQAQFILDALARWQFRPAALNGQVTRVEVLLIIPEDQD